MSRGTLDKGADLLSKQASQPLLGDAADPVETPVPTLHLPPSTDRMPDPADVSEFFGSLQHLCFTKVCFAKTDSGKNISIRPNSRSHPVLQERLVLLLGLSI